ncbi:hypothetical protein, partial [Xylella fastidiosa]|uniref:hypothetical protein n=1 Tax=Xylella fastidiosa TaxID=2371 RepID=UPI001396AC83
RMRLAHAVARLEAGPAREFARSAAQRVLRMPALHFTVPGFALLQGEGAANHRLVLWSSAGGDAWGVSDIHDTVFWRRGESLA